MNQEQEIDQDLEIHHPPPVFVDDPVKKAFRNHLVVSEILKKLPHDHIRTDCALINSLWRSCATNYLKRWTISKIMIRDWGDPLTPVGLKERQGLGEVPTKYRFISVPELETKMKLPGPKNIILLLRYYHAVNEVHHHCIDLVSPFITKLIICDGIYDLNYVPCYIRMDTPQLEHLIVDKMRFKLFRNPFVCIHPESIKRIQKIEIQNHFLEENREGIVNGTCSVEEILGLSNSPGIEELRKFCDDLTFKGRHRYDEGDKSRSRLTRIMRCRTPPQTSGMILRNRERHHNNIKCQEIQEFMWCFK